MSFPTPRRVLAVMAHPDDVEFMAGGTVAQWARAGVEIHYCLLTDGNSGSRDPSLTPMQLAALRREEQQAAGAQIGVKSYAFLGQHDGRLINTIDLRLQIARVIRRVQPDTVLTCDPLNFYSPRYINHPDHRAAAETTLASVMPLANTRLAAPELLEEGLEPHDVTFVYMASPVNPTHWIALSDEDMACKVAMMGAHTTQVSNGWDFKGMLTGFAQESARAAREHGIECELAESFYVVNLARG